MRRNVQPCKRHAELKHYSAGLSPHTTRLTPCRSQPAMMASGLYSVCCQLGRAL